jgi:hypothetical protein
MIGDEEPKPGRVEDLAGPGSDDAEIESDGDGVVDGGVDFGVGEEGNSVLEERVSGLVSTRTSSSARSWVRMKTLLGTEERRAAAVKEREGVGGVDREGRRVSLGIRTGRDEEGEWEIEKILDAGRRGTKSDRRGREGERKKLINKV